MVVAAVMAGGIGSRMGADLPKQYLPLAGTPIIVRTTRVLYASSEVDHVIVLVPEDWVDYTTQLMSQSGFSSTRVTVLCGGTTRNDTLQCALSFVDTHYGLADSILLTQDAVRPFLTLDMVSANIAAAKEYGCCNTVVPATDTIIESVDGKTISAVPDRSVLYQAQTPQTFKADQLQVYMDSLTDLEKETLTDGCKIFLLKGAPVHLVEGHVTNMKITYPTDMAVAEAILKETAHE